MAFRKKRSDEFDKAKHSSSSRYTFIIASDSDDRTRRFSVSSFWLNNIIVVGLVLAAGLVMFIISYSGLYSAYRQNKQDMITLQSINKEQQVQLYDMSEMAGAVEQKLEYLELLEERIQQFINNAGQDAASEEDKEALEEIDRELALMRSNMAVGGTSAGLNYFVSGASAADFDFTEEFASVKEYMSGIDTDTSNTLDSLDELVTDVSEYERLQNRYPNHVPLPYKSFGITQYYEYRIYPRIEFHKGMDLAAPGGTPINPCARGTVVDVGWRGEYGQMVMINHGNGFVTLYAHMSAIYAHIGDEVTVDDVIGAVGTTGFSTGNHLHFEIRYNGVTQNPLIYLPEIEEYSH